MARGTQMTQEIFFTFLGVELLIFIGLLIGAMGYVLYKLAKDI
jgi:flagellar biogenesis protein FliO